MCPNRRRSRCTSRAVRSGHVLELVRDLADVVGVVRHFVTNRVTLITAYEDIDCPVECRREKQRLAPRRGRIQETLNSGKESHVGHPVCLVDHDYLDSRQREIPLAQEVLEPSGTGDGNIHSLTQCVALAPETGATEEGVHPETTNGQQWPQGLCDLRGELPGRCKYEGRRTSSASSETVVAIGRANASVLPEPVGAFADTSLPASASAMVAAWIGRGTLIPCESRTATMSSGRPRSANDVTGASAPRATVDT